MKRWWPVAIGLMIAMMAPLAVQANTGSFSTSSSSNALTVVNSGSGKALGVASHTNNTATFTDNATSGAWSAVYGLQKSPSNNARGVFGWASANGIGRTYGVYGLTNASADNSSGVFGQAQSSSGITNGVYGKSLSVDGTGVYGNSPNGGIGVLGTSDIGMLGFGDAGVIGLGGAVGDGSYGLISGSDLGVGGHLMAAGADVAGTCAVAGSTTKTCDFPNAFPSAPIVLLTPASDPGTLTYYVTSTVTGFTIHLSSSGTVTFNYLAIGIDSTLAPPSATASASSRASDYRARFGR